MAHSDNLYVHPLESSHSCLSEDLICRICHGGQSIDELLTPCRCRGTIALVHLKCLETWLKESNQSNCELCRHRYKIIREPQYSIPWSILVFLRHPGLHLKEIILDFMSFSIYTPSVVTSTYTLMLIFEALMKKNIITTGGLHSHIIAFSAVFGVAAIDFIYSSWLIMTMKKHVEAWREWYNAHSKIKVVLPKIKIKPHRKTTQR
ncbi:LOW QUALITY PROTEIN: E3 ubiquitin-protein ligase MARCHF3-like [Euwallacea similis]|uniref:LOW QUALITY PROTEIN: E3 ubiquitin-protein ligase MARCHF3-like n=1 Tax=Euwallacea similis TaxID=1736056 RepID=UPI003450A933